MAPTTPADYLPVARELLAQRDDITDDIRERDKADVAGSAQRDAAAREAHRENAQTISWAQSAGIQMQRFAPGVDARSLAWALAVGGAIPRRVPADRRCEHARPGANRPFVAMLTPRWAACGECARRFASRFSLIERDADDGQCDVCDRPSMQFSEMTQVYGPMRVIANICGSCHFWLQGLPGGGE